MKLENAVFRRTPAGDAALRGFDSAVPVDHRRILAILEGATHVDAVRGYLRQYSDVLVEDWLSELLESGLIEIADPGNARMPDLAKLLDSGLGSRILRGLRDERVHEDGEARVAGVVLNRKGAYLSTGRLQNRGPLSKTAAQCVVLLVEDDPDQAALADLRIRTGGYGARLARSLQEMVEDLQTQPAPDLLLLDVNLPDGNGFDILAGLRRHPEFSMLPVIMLTVMASAEDVQHGLSLGADGYVTKPYSEEILLGTIRQVIGHA
jgi:CheY-like chemotaxis protein